MIAYRTFRNADPPGIAAVWRAQPPLRGLAQPLAARHLEQIVFSKPYFDPAGLIVAEEAGRIIGFAHAGFGPDESQAGLSYDMGTTCLVQVLPGTGGGITASELLLRSESYLRARGAKVLYGGGVFPLNPFYLGLYGGSESPGVLAGDELAVHLFRESGYREIDRVVVLRAALSGVKSVVDRKVLSVRRACEAMAVEEEPPPASWWEAQQYSHISRTRFLLRDRAGQVRSTATFCDLEGFAQSWGMHAVGLVQLETSPAFRRQGSAACLVGDAMKHWLTQGVHVVEVQTMQANQPALALYQRLGFNKVDEGIIFRKE